MSGWIDQHALNQLFLEARTHNKWQDKPVTDGQLREIVDLMKMAPTSANQSPARIVFLKSADAKERLKPHLMPGNVEKTMTAPVVAIIGHDNEFYEHLPFLFPHADAKSWFVGNQPFIERSAFQNGTLQVAYFIMAARAIGLDTGPMTGFNNAGVDAEFFAGTPVKSNVLVNLGYGDPAGLFPRSPRFSFEQIAKIV
ncbi:MAG: malonic semialdehyde reductase [Hyphomicrobiales bacterium]|nr:malonic semialdehyde reductase [Hyphomicrobiales bacterium]